MSEYYKVAVLGSEDASINALVLRFVSHDEKHDPTIADTYRREIKVDDSPAVLEIIDTAGDEQFLSLQDNCIRECQGLVLVYSILNRKTFTDLKTLRN